MRPKRPKPEDEDHSVAFVTSVAAPEVIVSYLELAKRAVEMPSPRAAGPTWTETGNVGGPIRSVIRLTLRETFDARRDIALLRRVHALIERYPGNHWVLLSIWALDGKQQRVSWRADALPGLRVDLARVLACAAES